ncbi:hypothetical protein ACX1C1_25020 [Paenibacillus sp. strain BS8-2]
MKPNNRITYRFDIPESRPKQDKPHRLIEAERTWDTAPDIDTEEQKQLPTSSKLNVIPLYYPSSSNVIEEAQPWNNAFQEDIGALEQLIREAESDDHPSSASKQTEWEHPIVPAAPEQVPVTTIITPQWQPVVDWEYETKTDKPVITRRTGGKGPSWLHVFLSVGGALATGAIFGYLILTLFTGATIWPGGERADNGGNTQPVVQPEVREPIGLDDLQDDPQVDETKGANENNLPAASIQAGSIAHTYTLLQFGLFSNAEGRDAALKQLKDGGFAAASMNTPEGYRVYAGMALDGTKAGVIVSNVPDLLLYKKPVTLQGPDQLPFAGGEEVAQGFFVSTNELIATWSDLVIAQLEQPSLSPLGAAAAEGWRTRHEQWTVHAAAMEKGVSDPGGETYFGKLRTAIDKAAVSMTEYDNNPSKAHLWDAETSLMEAVLAQKEWFESSSAL